MHERGAGSSMMSRDKNNSMDEEDSCCKSATGSGAARIGQRRTGGSGGVRPAVARSTAYGSNGAGYGSPALLLTSQSMSSVDDDDEEDYVMATKRSLTSNERLQPTNNHVG
jgi:hypothetical protein